MTNRLHVLWTFRRCGEGKYNRSGEDKAASDEEMADTSVGCEEREIDGSERDYVYGQKALGLALGRGVEKLFVSARASPYYGTLTTGTFWTLMTQTAESTGCAIKPLPKRKLVWLSLRRSLRS
jgi:hypothetical protein